MGNQVILQADGRWLCFEKPVQTIVAFDRDDVLAGLQAIESAVSQGLHAAGYIAYEAAAAFDLAVHPPPNGLPLLWFGLYQQPATSHQPPATSHQLPATRYQLGDWQPSVSWETYHAAIRQIKAQIAAGYTYQVNYTYHLRTDFSGDPLALFTDLAEAQQAEYAAYVDTGRHVICSASPELFFRLDGDVLTGKPMKGTAVRGRTLVEDKANMAWLHSSEKNQAENVMIVDMIRNDMGRVAEIGSVHVPRLFEVERYPTLHQMTSTVHSRTKAGLTDIMEAMFPCASITGAPKVSTMRIINALEPEPRGVYTGAIGFIAPKRRATSDRQARFNVAIRTVVVDRWQGTADYGVGSGIVWDSDAADEYEECRVKTRVLTQKRPSFSLLESLLWEPEGGYFLLNEHLTRLKDSAEYFGIDVDETAVRERLKACAEQSRSNGDLRLKIDPPPQKVRLLVDQNGEITLQTIPLSQGAQPEPLRIGLAVEPVDSSNIWLYHKTTHRQVYEQARNGRPDCDDVILWNERGEITEGISANIVVELGNQLWTPPIESGLLSGTFRWELLDKGEIGERIVTVDELHQCRRIWLINSVRRWREATLVMPKLTPHASH